MYETVRIHTGFHGDLLVENQVIVEIKALEAVAPVHKEQLLTYLKLADKHLGLWINFNVALIKDGITRIVNRAAEQEFPARPNLCGKGHWELVEKQGESE